MQKSMEIPTIHYSQYYVYLDDGYKDVTPKDAHCPNKVGRTLEKNTRHRIGGIAITLMTGGIAWFAFPSFRKWVKGERHTVIVTDVKGQVSKTDGAAKTLGCKSEIECSEQIKIKLQGYAEKIGGTGTNWTQWMTPEKMKKYKTKYVNNEAYNYLFAYNIVEIAKSEILMFDNPLSPVKNEEVIDAVIAYFLKQGYSYNKKSEYIKAIKKKLTPEHMEMLLKKDLVDDRYMGRVVEFLEELTGIRVFTSGE